MTHFLFSSLCLLAFWLFYKLALENISWHRFKRFYLLGVLVVSVVIPFIVVKVNYINIQPQFFNSSTVSDGPAMILNPVTDHGVVLPASAFDWWQLIGIMYIIGFVVMTVRFGRNLWSLKINSSDEISRLGRYTLVKKDGLSVPCSFMNRIYIPKNKEVPTHILDHEKAHLDQRHSWDIIFIELILIVFWFHPLIYLMKYSIKLNHEFLADQAVLKNGFPLSNYQKSLLEFIQWEDQKQLAHTYNFPLIKKRFTIMNTKTKNSQAILRTLAIIPVLGLLIISCGKEKEELVTQAKDGFLTNEQYDYVINPYQKNGIIRYQNNNYTYQIHRDYSVTAVDKEGDTLTNTTPFLAWDTEKEWNQVKSETKELNDLRENLIINVFDFKIPYADFKEPNKKIKGINHMLDFLKEQGFGNVGVTKYFKNETEHVSFFKSHDISIKDDKSIDKITDKSNKPLYINNNSPKGFVEIEGKTYRYTNNETGIKIFDQNNKEINWYEKGWDIRERLVVPNDKDLANLNELYTGLKKGSKIFVDGKEITEAEYKKLMTHHADSVRIENKNGYNYYYLYNLTPPEDNFELVSNDESSDINVIKTTQAELDRKQQNPVATCNDARHAIKTR